MIGLALSFLVMLIFFIYPMMINLLSSIFGDSIFNHVFLCGSLIMITVHTLYNCIKNRKSM